MANSLFGPSSQKPKIITFNASILQASFKAKSAQRLAALGAAQKAKGSNKAVAGPESRKSKAVGNTPWANEKKKTSPIASQYLSIKNKTKFIDLHSAAVRKAGGKKDAKALYALYTALRDMKTLTEYASQKKTLPSQRARLTAQLKGGLREVQEYLKSAQLNKLSLLFGEKTSHATSLVSLGKNKRDVIGARLSIFKENQTLPNLTGTEKFSLTLKKGNHSNVIEINLADVAKPLTSKNLIQHVNAKIFEIKTLDKKGNLVGKYQTRFAFNKIDNKKFGLKIDVAAGENVALDAIQSEPALFIIGTERGKKRGSKETSSITNVSGLNGQQRIKAYTRIIAGTNGQTPVETTGVKNKITSVAGTAKKTPVETGLAETTARATAVDSQGNVYVVGSTKGHMGQQKNVASKQDVFITKFDSVGNEVWKRLVGAHKNADAYAIAVDNKDNIVIVGQTEDGLEKGDVFSGKDSFVAKYNSQGTPQWVKQLDTVASNKGNALAVDGAGNIYVGGETSGRLHSTVSPQGRTDGYLVKLNDKGVVQKTHQFGTAGFDAVKSISLAQDGSILVASKENGSAVLRKLDKDDVSKTLATYNLGDLGGGDISGIAVEGDNIYISGFGEVSGFSAGGTVTSAHRGGRDGFVVKLKDTGVNFSAQWTHFLGTTSMDTIEGITVKDGAVYVVGRTSGTLPGSAKKGLQEAFAAKITGETGAREWIYQINKKDGYSGATAIGFSKNGNSVLTKLGLPSGRINYTEDRKIITQTSVRPGDHFYISVNQGAKRKITIAARDTYATLAQKINRISNRYIKARQSLIAPAKPKKISFEDIKDPREKAIAQARERLDKILANRKKKSAVAKSKTTMGQPHLRIESRNGSILNIFSGKNGQDALVKLGLDPRKILPAKLVSGKSNSELGADPKNLGGTFALKLSHNYGLNSVKESEFMTKQIETAMEEVKRAYRSLSYDPIKAQILKNSKVKKGKVPPYLTKQLANYQTGLQRLLAGGTKQGLLK